MRYEQIQSVLSNERLGKYKKHLLKQMEISVYKITKRKIHNANDFVAALLAQYVINFTAASNMVATTRIDFNPWYDAVTAIRNAIKNTVDDAALEAAYKACRTARTAINDAGDKASRNAFKNVGKAGLLKCLNLKEEEGALYKARQKLKGLFILAYASQEHFLQYFLTSFDDAKGYLDNCPNFVKPKDEIIAICALHTWAKPELATNPYIS